MISTEFGREVAAIVEREFQRVSNAELVEIDEPANASYIKVTFKIGKNEIIFKIAPEVAKTPEAIRQAVQRHIFFAQRKRKAVKAG